VPEIDEVYRFDRDTTLAILAGFVRALEQAGVTTVDWAVARLEARPEARKLLVVVSDGCPMDGATNLANDAWYLDNHPKVLQRHGRNGRVEICAMGVGLDLSPFYSHCQALDLGVPPGHAVLRDILQLLARPARR
jgi:cobaltochelatase CobT